MTIIRIVLICLFTGLGVQGLSQEASAPFDEQFPDGIGKHRELFLHDDEIVESRENVKVVIAQAEKLTQQPVVKQDQPWELGHPRWINVLYDAEEQLYKMWYQCLVEYEPYSADPGKRLALLYATSRDGINWEKPLSNIKEYAGKPTNITFFAIQTKKDFRAPYVIKDYSDPDPQARYKALFHCWDFRGRGLGAAISPDGVRWSAPHAYNVMQGGFDTHNTFFWDPQYGSYVAYVRRWQYGKRHIARATSPDFFHWSNDETVMGPDERDAPDEDFYTPACFRLKEVRNVYIMVTGVFDGKKNIVTPQLAVSRDGINWTRFRQPFIPFGEPGAWDDAGGWPSAREIPAGEHQLFYYQGVRAAHADPDDQHGQSGVGVTRIKRDRYIGLSAPDEGTVTTRPVRLTHHAARMPERGVLTLNAEATNGQIRVEVLDANGNPVPGFTRDECVPFTGDELDVCVRWQDHPNLYPVIGKPVKLKFYLKNATVYGFQVLRNDPER